ncbi:MAG: hypothetical protein ACAH83_13890 [Alphaproteobacteria bacterium]
MKDEFNKAAPTRTVSEDGDVSWWNAAGELHREDGPAVELTSGSKIWYRNGKYHREDGPAAEWHDGTTWWCRDGRFHREDGPACIDADGTTSWWLKGEPVAEQDILNLMKAKAGAASAPKNPKPF